MTTPAAACPEPANPPRRWTIVSQCKSDRVVYFTDDPDYQPPMEADWYYCSTYLGELPDGMTLRNCWGWRFRGSRFSDAREPATDSTAESLLDHNRRALLRLLKDKIDDIRRPYAPSCLDGQTLRAHKLQQARDWLTRQDGATDTSASDQGWPHLSLVAHTQGLTLDQAARWIVAQAQAQEQMWLDTERFREQLTRMIQTARSQTQLMELREWLLDAVYPALSHQFRYPQSHTEPLDTTAQLDDTARLHEIARLKAQLRDGINTRRKALHSAYVLGEQVWQHKLRQARLWLSQPDALPDDPPPAGYELLQGYAQARGWGLQEAARTLLDAASQSTQTLLETERVKDELLARIEALTTWADVQQIDQALKDLAWALPSPAPLAH